MKVLAVCGTSNRNTFCCGSGEGRVMLYGFSTPPKGVFIDRCHVIQPPYVTLSVTAELAAPLCDFICNCGIGCTPM